MSGDGGLKPRLALLELQPEAASARQRIAAREAPCRPHHPRLRRVQPLAGGAPRRNSNLLDQVERAQVVGFQKDAPAARSAERSSITAALPFTIVLAT